MTQSSLFWQFGSKVDEEISPIDWLNIAQCARQRGADRILEEGDYWSHWLAEYTSLKLACAKAGK